MTTPMFQGDEIVPDASLVFDNSAVFAVSADEIWPWIVQLGKRRAGWYMPAWLERLIVWPRSRRAATRIDGRWQGLSVDDQVPDYGGRDEYLEVRIVDPPNALVYRSERRGAVFSWALLLEPAGAGHTRLHARFRGRIKSAGFRGRAIELFGGLFDKATIVLMFAGLRERVER